MFLFHLQISHQSKFTCFCSLAFFFFPFSCIIRIITLLPTVVMLTYTFYLDVCWPWWAQNPTTEMKMLVCLPYCCQAAKQAVLPVSISSLPSSTMAYLHCYSGQGAFVLLILPEKWGIWRKSPFCVCDFRSTVLHKVRTKWHGDGRACPEDPVLPSPHLHSSSAAPKESHAQWESMKHPPACTNALQTSRKQQGSVREP